MTARVPDPKIKQLQVLSDLVLASFEILYVRDSPPARLESKGQEVSWLGIYPRIARSYSAMTLTEHPLASFLNLSF